jgi:hypothetical protein
VTCLPRLLHFSLVLRFYIFPFLLFHFYLMVHCSTRLISSILCFYCPAFHILVFLLSPSPTLGRLPQSSNELRFSPSYCCCFVSIYQYMFYLLSFFFFFFFSYRWLSSSPFPALVRNFPSCNVFPQSPMDDYASPFLLPPTSMLLAGTMLLRT